MARINKFQLKEKDTLHSPNSCTTYGKSLGLELNQIDDVILTVKEGLPISSFEQLSKILEVSLEKLAVITGIAVRTLARRKREGKLQPTESERLFRIGFLFDKAILVLDGTESARQWFKTPKKALGGKTPLEYSDTEVGAREVEDLLGRMEHGVFS